MDAMAMAPFKEVVQFCQATIMAQSNEEYVVVRGHTVTNQGILQCLHVPSGEWIILPAKSSTVGSNLASLERSRIVVIGGAKEGTVGTGEMSFVSLDISIQEEEQPMDDLVGDQGLQATKECLVWTADLEPLFGVLAAAMALAATTLATTSSAASTSRNGSSAHWQEEYESTVDDETTVHPFLYPPTMIAAKIASSGASVVSARSAKSSRTKSSQTSASGRKKVRNYRTIDNFGEHVTFTGYVTMDKERAQGKGRMTWILTGDHYEGSFDQGARQGRGKMTYSNGDTFAGIFKDDEREGKGIYRYKDGRVYVGNYVKDLPEDTNGKLEWRDGTVYTGDFLKGKRSGKGTIHFPDQKAKYEGDFVKGKYHGFGTCTFADGSVYEGEWKHGRAHGKGKLLDSESNLIHDGQWSNDAPVYGVSAGYSE